MEFELNHVLHAAGVRLAQIKTDISSCYTSDMDVVLHRCIQTNETLQKICSIHTYHITVWLHHITGMAHL